MNKEQQNTQDKPSLYVVNSELLDLLYQLKEQSQPIIGARVRLDKLIQDISYRKRVLSFVINSDDDNSIKLAWKIMHLQKEIHAQEEAALFDLDANPQPTSAQHKAPTNSQPVNMMTGSDIQSETPVIQTPILSDEVKPKQVESKQKTKNAPITVLDEEQKIEINPAATGTTGTTGTTGNYTRPAIVGLLALTLVLIATYLGASSFTNQSESVPPEEVASMNISQIPQKLFNIHGSNTVGEVLAPSLLDAYMVMQGASDTRIVVGDSALDREIMIQQSDSTLNVIGLASHGSSTGFKALMDDKADIAMSSRKIKHSEVEQLMAEYGDLSSPNSEHIIGLDGLAIIVNPNNPISALTTQQIAQLFSGEVTDWQDLGGSSGQVSVYARASNSGTWDTFKSLVLKPNKTELVETAQRFESSSELSDMVAADAGGIGFIALPYVRYAKLLAVSEGTNTMPIVPTAFTIGTEDYPLSRRLYLYLPQNADNQVKSFVEFVHTQAGQDVVEKHGFVSQNIFASSPHHDKSYPWAYRNLTKSAQRLSLNFRFNSASNTLDNKANRDLNRVVDYIFQNKGRRVLLFGFTDSTGDSEKNLALSQQRVETIEMALNARGVYPAVSRGFGEAIPIASNSTAHGRYKNRRVEIWIE